MLNLEIIKNDYKKRGVDALQQHDYDTAIHYFNNWQYVYPCQLGIDKYNYDSEILDAINNSLSEYMYKPEFELRKDGKICVVYLVQGILNSSSVVPKIIISLSEFHDKSKFDIHVFFTETWLSVYRNSGRIFIKKFKDAGCQVHYAPLFKSGFLKIRDIAYRINSLNPHILVTTAALADFNHYFIAMLKPAPVTIGFVLGSPPQFISPSFNCGISWLTRAIQNCPVPCLNSGQIYVSGMPLKNKILRREEFGIPKDAMVIISAGRYTKFKDPRILNLIIDLMDTLPNLYYLVIGPHPNQVPIFNNLPENVRHRIIRYQWSESYEDYFGLADIYLDTFPSGGGITLHDAALVQLPIISFTDSTSMPFVQSDWNPAQDLFYPGSITLINRNNLDEIKPVVKDLYYLKSKRDEMGKSAYQNIIFSRFQIKKNVKKIEDLYISLVEGGIK